MLAAVVVLVAVLVAVVVVVLAAVVVVVAVLVGRLFLYIKDKDAWLHICKLKDYLVKFFLPLVWVRVWVEVRTGVTVQVRMLLGWVDWERGK